ncbi:serine proteinase [Pseudoflavonifractor phocaeensis]|uniref:serine proteinase n=1 Tax=Pseudoflavonifractor phocaeensis TaxID=1870988 RepID=UPI0025A41ECD|nr:serine proteinase [Pseudoflavonifractor phocaeensis]MDM8239540.1 serine proteinase [Pseudoflavonifractor phocaeensis]
MDFINDLQERATDLAQSVVATSKRLAEIAKLKASNMAEEDTIKKAYVELGKLYYAEHGATPDGAYAAACEKITAARAAIETNNDRIAELKATAEAEGEIIDVTPEAAQEPESDVTEADIVPEEPAAEAPAADEEQPKE